MLQALRKVVFLPFALTMDSWLWRISNGSVTEKEYNREWWLLRYNNQGLIPPVYRHEGDLDASSKYHIAYDISYIRYFISHLLQFQFYEAMCERSGHKGPLHRCDFYQSKAAGDLLKYVLHLQKKCIICIILLLQYELCSYRYICIFSSKRIMTSGDEYSENRIT